ncbi:ERV/ALR sulfhydryl oxidase domain-containing protein [Chytridium lagenaria]|nr:ERV/ALR sulfhydryl oxidase domain-containing protein [Chytridium lagenaria]
MLFFCCRAELGRAAWRLLHTMAGKFPYKPTEEQKTVMRDYIYLFAQLYPCGDCARHFAIVLEAHPPIVEDRISLSTWACDVHNVVNKRLNKTLFDCATVLEVYKCGCAEEDGATMTIPDVKPTGKPKTVDMETVKMLGRPKLGKAVKEK